MYINIPLPPKRCTECGAIEQTEEIRRSSGRGATSVILRCTECGHEKCVATETVGTYPDDGTFVVYNMPPKPEYDDF